MKTTVEREGGKVALLEKNPIAYRLTGRGVSATVPHPLPNDECTAPETQPAFWPIQDEAGPYRVFAATGIALRTRAFRLAKDMYRKCGFVTDSHDLLVEPYDYRKGTLVLFAEDEKGQAAATMSLVSDTSDAGIPADRIFHSELQQLRREGRRLAEGVRLAIADEHLFSKDLFLQMLNLLYIHGRFNRKATDLLVEVNPRHVAYYQRVFGFEPLGPERACPRVNGAPARLMRLRIQTSAARARTGKASRETLAIRFYPPQKEVEALRFIRRNWRSMSVLEQAHFSSPRSRAARHRSIASCNAKF